MQRQLYLNNNSRTLTFSSGASWPPPGSGAFYRPSKKWKFVSAAAPPWPPPGGGIFFHTNGKFAKFGSWENTPQGAPRCPGLLVPYSTTYVIGVAQWGPSDVGHGLPNFFALIHVGQQLQTASRGFINLRGSTASILLTL